MIVPNLIDPDLQEALTAVKAIGLRCSDRGVAVVVIQRPRAGVPAPKGSIVSVRLSND